MKDTYFHHEKYKFDTVYPYISHKGEIYRGKIYSFGNYMLSGNITSTTRDCHKFFQNYRTLLKEKYFLVNGSSIKKEAVVKKNKKLLQLYESLYYFKSILLNGKWISLFIKTGGEDYSEYDPTQSLSTSLALKVLNKDQNITIVIFENYREDKSALDLYRQILAEIIS